MPIDPRLVKWDESEPAAPAIDARMVKWDEAPEEKSALAVARDVLAGGVRGAGSIGATILAPIDMAKDAYNGKGWSLESNRQRRADMDAGLQSLGVDTDSLSFKTGKLAGEVAGTAGAGGVLANGARAVGASPAVVSALSSGGFSLGRPAATTVAGKAADLALRTGAGATVGGASAGMIDPEQAGVGAAFGGALPGGVQLAGKLGSLIKNGSSLVAKNVLGASTGAGAEAIGAAYKAGKEGSKEFIENMRGNASFEDVVDMAKQGVANMRQARGQAYRSGMVDIKNDKAILEFSPIDEAISKVESMGKFKDVAVNSKSSGIVDEMAGIVDEWKNLNPAEYHTPEGMDALKRSIGEVRESAQFGTPARRAADEVYNAVKSQIDKQAPTYAKVMKDYSEASKTLSEVERALSTGERASKDTAVRKLQSLLRNNAQTNYGNRLKLAETLEQQGGVSLMPSIAGQAMNSWMPRGMVGAIEKGAMLPGAVLAPKALALAPLASPRLVGEGVYAMGKAAGNTGRMMKSVSEPIGGLLSSDTSTNALLRTVPYSILSTQRAPQ